jgi:hypothetical protein
MPRCTTPDSAPDDICAGICDEAVLPEHAVRANAAAARLEIHRVLDTRVPPHKRVRKDEAPSAVAGLVLAAGANERMPLFALTRTVAVQTIGR